MRFSMRDVKDAAIELFFSLVRDFEEVRFSQTSMSTVMVLRKDADGDNKVIAQLYFHDNNLIIETTAEMGREAWDRYEYQDPGYPETAVRGFLGQVAAHIRRVTRFMPAATQAAREAAIASAYAYSRGDCGIPVLKAL